MGCCYAKTLEFEEKPKRGRLRSMFGRDHRRNKVQTIHIGEPVGLSVNEGTPMLNLARKTEQTVLMQLREEGIIPNRGLGGVAFTIDLKDKITDPSTSDDDYYQLPGVPQCSRGTTKVVQSRPRKLPPLTTRSVPDKMPLGQRENDAVVVKNEVLRRKGEMARISEHRRGLAAARKEAREKEKRIRLEEKLMKKALQKDGELEKETVNDRIERAKFIRELKAEDIRTRTEAKLAKVSRTENSNKIPSTEERLERARQKREKRLAERRERWEKKERRIEEMKSSRRVNTPVASIPNIEV